MITHTHTVVELEITRKAYDEIRRLLREADYHHCFDVKDVTKTGNGPIDLTGIAIIPRKKTVDK